jgi:hypothetical protein
VLWCCDVSLVCVMFVGGGREENSAQVRKARVDTTVRPYSRVPRYCRDIEISDMIGGDDAIR